MDEGDSNFFENVYNYMCYVGEATFTAKIIKCGNYFFQDCSWGNKGKYIAECKC